jgi:hypothetical protein
MPECDMMKKLRMIPECQRLQSPYWTNMPLMRTPPIPHEIGAETAK